uniref:C-type lectin domain-containing protein n=1 Tax=Glossina brevipalpis TaxID=37001 RepID=A0A1A9WYT6_9MUSC
MNFMNGIRKSLRFDKFDSYVPSIQAVRIGDPPLYMASDIAKDISKKFKKQEKKTNKKSIFKVAAISNPYFVEYLFKLGVSFTFCELALKLSFQGQKQDVSWFKAHAICRTVDGNLVSIDNQPVWESLNEYLEANFPDKSRWWTSANDLALEGEFIWWNTGTSMSYNVWEKGQPNNKDNNQHCVALEFENKRYEMNDLDCNSRNAFICESGPNAEHERQLERELKREREQEREQQHQREMNEFVCNLNNEFMYEPEKPLRVSINILPWGTPPYIKFEFLYADKFGEIGLDLGLQFPKNFSIVAKWLKNMYRNTPACEGIDVCVLIFKILHDIVGVSLKRISQTLKVKLLL